MATNLNDLIFIKRVKKAHHDESHGGAWKIAYADFVTAMMAFFLLMWLLNATTEEQKTAISNYFAPMSVSKSTSGAGGVLGGRTIDQEGAMSSQMGSPRILLGLATPDIGKGEDTSEESTGTEMRQGPVDEHTFEPADSSHLGTLEAHDIEQESGVRLGTVDPNDAEDAVRQQLARADYSSGPKPADGTSAVPGMYKGGQTPQALAAQAAAERLANEEDERFDNAAEAIEKAISENPGLSEFKDNLRVEQTAAGLRIQLLDDDERTMFPLGSAEMLPHTAELMAKVTEVIKDLHNKIAIAGHTDAIPYRLGSGYGNWELSTDRAHASRRALVDAGLTDGRIQNVSGKAASDPLIKSDPEAPGNRRISIVLLRQAPPPDAFGGFQTEPTPRPALAPSNVPIEQNPTTEPAPQGGLTAPNEVETTAPQAPGSSAIPAPSDVSEAIGEFGDNGADMNAGSIEDASGSDLWQRLN